MNIRVLREAGGLGDIVRILPAIRGLREKYPTARIDVFLPGAYAPLVRRAGDADNIIETSFATRRSRLAEPDEERWPYLRTGVAYDRTVDLYCPAFAYELRHGRDVWHDRIELFCMAAGVLPREMRPRIPIAEKELDTAKRLLRSLGIAERRGWVALQPFSTDPARDWPREKWKMLANALSLEGYGVFALDCVPDRTADFPCPRVTGQPLLAVGAVLQAIRLLIGPDSGLLHLAAAVGGRGMGLTASQSGAVLYRHYPDHTYVQPDDPSAPEGCNWPCYWRRPGRCARLNLKAAGKTCAALAGLPVAAVAQAAVQLLDRGGRRLPDTPPVGPSSGSRSVPLPARVIPARDRSIHHLDFRRLPGTTLAQAIGEHFRVLRVGGTLRAPTRLQRLLRDHAFTVGRRGPLHSVYLKEDTWPKWY